MSERAAWGACGGGARGQRRQAVQEAVGNVLEGVDEEGERDGVATVHRKPSDAEEGAKVERGEREADAQGARTPYEGIGEPDDAQGIHDVLAVVHEKN